MKKQNKKSVIESNYLNSKKYKGRRPLISIRSNLPKEILKFIMELKKQNNGSAWINKAIIEKYERDNPKKEDLSDKSKDRNERRLRR